MRSELKLSRCKLVETVAGGNKKRKVHKVKQKKKTESEYAKPQKGLENKKA